MTSRPRYSLVVPTRNRAALLSDALASATALTHPDVEIIVSDNASTDDTREVATTTGDPRVRYVRTDTVLAQSASWDFAVTHASGDYVTILGDDDGIVPSLYERIDDVLVDHPGRAVAWREAWYTHGAFPPPGLAEAETNVLTIEAMPGGVREVRGPDQLERFFARREQAPLPGVVNSAIPRDVLERVRGRVGRLFPAPDPAVSIITAILALEPSYVAVDQPLGLKGLSGATLSIGLFHADRDLHESIDEFDTDDLFTEVPLQTRTGTNLVAESLLRMKRILPEELAGHELDLVRYFVTTRQEMADARRRADDDAAIAEWNQVLQQQSSDVRSGVRRELARQRAGARTRAVARQIPGLRTLRSAAHLFPGWSRHRRPVGGQGHPWEFRLVNGAEHGFLDLPGAARYLDRHVLRGGAIPRPSGAVTGSNAPDGRVTASNSEVTSA